MSVRTFLIGGGWSEACRGDVWGPFLSAGALRPVVACVVFDEGDGVAQFERWASVLSATSACRPEPVLIGPGRPLELAALSGADALLVCGGLTPGYAEGFTGSAAGVGEWLAAGRPYAGFSAGAALAAGTALVGGWRWRGRPVCPPDTAEDLEELTTAEGLGLVPFAIDVHAAQWGTVSRSMAAVRHELVPAAVALDEDTLLIDGSLVAGAGQAWCAVPGLAGTVQVWSVPSGDRLPAELSRFTD